MAKDVVILNRCDGDHQAEPPEGTTVRIDIGQGKFEVELCEDCRASLIDPVEKLQVRGRMVDSQVKAKLRCPWCSSALASAGFLRQHVETKHPDQVGEFVQALLGRGKPATPKLESPKAKPKPRPEPAESDGQAKDGRLQKKTCPECGKVCGGPQGLFAHMRVHKVQPKAKCPDCNASISVQSMGVHRANAHGFRR